MARFSQKIRTLQWADRRLGVPVCFGLTLARKIGAWFAPSLRSEPACQSLLFLKLTEQGSTVLACEAVQAAIARVGREHVHFLVFEENRFIVDVLGLVPAENVHTVRTASLGAMLTSGCKTLREIRRRKIDACIDLEFFARFSAMIAFLTGARLRVGFHAYAGGPYRGDLFTHRVVYNPQLHTRESFLNLVLALDSESARLPTLDPEPSSPIFPPRFHYSPEEKQVMRAQLEHFGVRAENGLILLNANAGDLLPLRKWAGENYVELAQRLLREFPEVQIALTGSPEEAARVNAYVQAIGSPRCFSLAGRTTLRQLLVVYELAQVLVTNDSGPAHFAALTDIDAIVLFGPETPALFAAPGPRTHVIWAGIACSPCVNAFNNRQTACRDNVCMQRISVNAVFQKTCGIYRQRKLRAA